MMARGDLAKTLAMYESMSDSGLIDLLCAFKLDYQGARGRDDVVCMRFCEERMELIESVIRNRGAKP